MLKKDELAINTSCLNKATPTEPVFVLRAKDAFAAQTVRLWAAMAEGSHEPEKIEEALELAERMYQWRAQNVAETAPAQLSTEKFLRR
jgi:hypothetical protein